MRLTRKECDYLLFHLRLGIGVGAGVVEPIPVGRAIRLLQDELQARRRVVLVEDGNLVCDLRVAALAQIRFSWTCMSEFTYGIFPPSRVVSWELP